MEGRMSNNRFLEGICHSTRGDPMAAPVLPRNKQNQIFRFMHCAECRADLDSGRGRGSMKYYARVNVGITPHGFQVWCVRHNRDVCHMTPKELGEVLLQAMGSEGAA
jgi:hypothetical protein